MDSRTGSGYFIGYPEKSKGYRFYCPNHSPRIVETGNAKFLENGEVSGSVEHQIVELKEIKVNVPLPISVPSSTINQNVVPIVAECNDNIEQHLNEETPLEETNIKGSDTQEPQGIILRRSQRERRSTISDDYVIYLHELDFDLGINKDPVSFLQAIESVESDKWINAMKNELKSMEQNNVWDLVELPIGCKRVWCKWVFKTKRDSNGNIE